MIFKNLKIRPVHTKPPAIDAISDLAPASLAVSWLMPLAPMERPEFLATTLASLEGQSLQANELVIAADGPLPNGLREVIAASRLPIRAGGPGGPSTGRGGGHPADRAGGAQRSIQFTPDPH